MNWDLELQRKWRKTLRVLDNCAADPHLGSLKNIELEFLSLNTTSLVQTMDMGIVAKLHPWSNSRKSTYIIFSS
jgi:hypothetical protein